MCPFSVVVPVEVSVGQFLGLNNGLSGGLSDCLHGRLSDGQSACVYTTVSVSCQFSLKREASGSRSF
jgi:hypothetical protein